MLPRGVLSDDPVVGVWEAHPELGGEESVFERVHERSLGIIACGW